MSVQVVLETKSVRVQFLDPSAVSQISPPDVHKAHVWRSKSTKPVMEASAGLRVGRVNSDQLPAALVEMKPRGVLLVTPAVNPVTTERAESKTAALVKVCVVAEYTRPHCFPSVVL